MKTLAGLLSRYKNIKAPQRVLREAFIAAVYQETGIEIAAAQVEVLGKNVRLNVPSVVKSEIHMNQQNILKRVGESVSDEYALTTIF